MLVFIGFNVILSYSYAKIKQFTPLFIDFRDDICVKRGYNSVRVYPTA